MARIRNSSLNNAYSDGKEQIFIDDTGKEYTIRNSSLDNIYGDGKQKIVKERGSSSDSLLVDLISGLPIIVQIIIVVVGIIALMSPGFWIAIFSIF